MAKSTFVAFLLWLCFGLFGAHHFYLGRDVHGMLWLTSLGGFFINWFFDLFFLSDYVAEANRDPYFMEKHDLRVKYSKPSFISGTLYLQVVFGTIVHHLAAYAIPQNPEDEFPEVYLVTSVVSALATTVVIHAIGNTGTKKGSLFWALFGTFTAEVVSHIIHCVPEDADEDFIPEAECNCTFSYGFMVALIGAFIFTFSRKFRTSAELKARPKRGLCKRAGVVILCMSLFAGASLSYLYYNVTWHIEGRDVRPREVLQEFFDSPEYQLIRKKFLEFIALCREDGWETCFDSLFEELDVGGMRKSYRTLELPTTATKEEVKRAYHTLAKKWHPDKCDQPNCSKKFQVVCELPLCGCPCRHVFSNLSSILQDIHKAYKNIMKAMR